MVETPEAMGLKKKELLLLVRGDEGKAALASSVRADGRVEQLDSGTVGDGPSVRKAPYCPRTP